MQRKNAGFAIALLLSGCTSPVAAFGRDREARRVLPWFDAVYPAFGRVSRPRGGVKRAVNGCFSPFSSSERPGTDPDAPRRMFRRGKAGVDAAFHEIKAFMQNKGLEADSPVINEGDWIGLEDGHEVAAYGSGEREFSAVYTAFTPPDPPPFDGYQGNTLRLIVVGINSFRSKGPYGAHVTAAIKKALEYATSRWTAVASLPTASP